MNCVITQNNIILEKLMQFYHNKENLDKMLSIITGVSNISLRIIDWFVTNYAKKNYIVLDNNEGRFKVYDDYKLKLKAYSKQRFDPFCRWQRINIPYKTEEGAGFETTIGQLNFFKWALENNIVNYIEEHYQHIEQDMNTRNSTSRKKRMTLENELQETDNSRKKREELSVSATKSIKKETVQIKLTFNS
jgi:hypothetical protein